MNKNIYLLFLTAKLVLQALALCAFVNLICCFSHICDHFIYAGELWTFDIAMGDCVLFIVCLYFVVQ